ncbi:sigma-70 family RNA polymerase sigma factor [Streptomyces sp. JAC18]|uniref:RNA polymerase, sigma 70 family subunit n=1 Tax=Streptomyces pratensis (strain ATCC 33331 / IAF-45CD) TaxID=591167 RepID=A0A8D4B9S9_STRFA|nr:sigma-70 family RNA polymerase sigma factor [Streptomyces sp. SID7815]MYT49092.1 sigma-70 family RNA polymerase sigma factor [Streptomyces sp. SID7815]
MGETRETALIKAAQKGDPEAQDRLVASYLPLVYNIVGRALNGHADVDDVVQDSVLRMIRGLPSLRTPKSFRSWLVAITMNEIRGHWRERSTGGMSADPIQDAYDVVDPAADFVELTIVRLGLTGQRREAAEATRWLDDDDRELVSLWWLETAGELSRAEVASALDLSPQHTAVRVQRMKERLEAARVVVRALAADPRCVLLEDLTVRWDGVPSALWRKRLARHARECTVCAGHRSGLVPAEGLLVGLALVPVAASFAGTSEQLLPTAFLPATAAAAGPGRAERRRDSARRRRRTTVVAGLAAVAVLGGGGAAVHLYTDDTDEDAATAVAPLDGPPAPVSTASSPSAAPSSASPTPSSASPSPSAPPSPSASRSRSATATATPEKTRKPSTPSSKPMAAPEASSAPSVADEVIALVNTERAKEGCGAVSGNGLLAKAASDHSADMVARDYFSHTSPDGTDPGARITAAGYRWSTYGENIAKGQQTAESVMDAWMNSEGHRANILNCALKELGVGRVDSSGGPVWTQNFGTAL